LAKQGTHCCAAYFGVSVRTVQEWEQGRAGPSGPSRTLLIVIDREPEAVRRALVTLPIGGKTPTGVLAPPRTA